MPKGFWITWYRSVSDQAAVARYANLAGSIIERHGGRILARGNPVTSYEGGADERVAVIEFESVERAIAAYESPEYQAALAVQKGSAEREVRIVRGV